MNKKVDTISKLSAIALPTAPTSPADGVSAKPTSRFSVGSGVGAFLDANAQKIRADKAEQQLAELLDSSSGERTLYINPDDVDVWGMHDRETKLAFSDDDPSWVEFKQTIAATGGNRESVKVRRTGGGRFELIAGRRRLQAVREQGLRLKAEVLSPEVNDRQAWIDMRVENEGGQALSLVEKARSYATALDKGLFANQNELCTAVGTSKGDLSTLLSLARIPAQAIDALGDWRALTRQQVRNLIEVHKQVGDAELLKRAKAIPDDANTLATKVSFLQRGKVEVVPPAKISSSTFVGGVMRTEDRKVVLTFDSAELAQRVSEEIKLLLKRG